MKIDEALGKFLTQLEADGRSRHTVGQYRRHIRLLAAWAAAEGITEIARLDHEAVARFLASSAARRRCDGRAKKGTAVNCLRTSLRGFTRFLHEAGYLAEDPGRLVRRAMCGMGPPKAITPEEAAKLLATLAGAAGPEAERDHALIHLLVATGVRLSAAANLDVAGLDLDRSELTVRTKGDRSERVFLGKDIRKHLGRYVGKRRSGPLFPTKTGKRVTNRHLQRRFGEWLKRAGITRALSPHALRHGFALGLYRRTGDVLLVKEALHHRSIASTLVYARVDEERLRRAMG
jgi:site-specific recombinase XerC